MTYPSTHQLSPNWLIEYVRVFLRTPPAVPKLTPTVANGQFRLEIAGCSRGFRYLLQKSDDLKSWTTVDDFVSDGGPLLFSEAAVGRRFYRVARP